MTTKKRKQTSHPSCLCVEGVIGVGKTSLCNLIAEEFNARTILEDAEENPFLAEFYRNRQSTAFQTQLWFLLSRCRQLSEELPQQDLFHDTIVCDYIFAKDRLFASINLDENEMAMYTAVAGIIERNVSKPDLVLYLQAATDVLMERIRRRGRSCERNMDRNYLAALNEAYNHFFFHYSESPVLIVNTDEVDFVNNRADFDELIRQILDARWGSTYYRPLGNRDRAIIEEKQENT